ncbi:MAG: PIN domain nuclease [Chloroflexi bacterium]|nr:PIN domain nuclease [Chloroflexota bacterium]MBU1746630.1 PIN domain nuclease [Chloroflexota bacterium]
MSVDLLFRFIGLIIFALVGWQVGALLGSSLEAEYYRYGIIFSILGASFGLLLTPYFTTVPFRALRRLIRRIPARDLLAAVLGLVIGLIVSALLSFPLSMLPAPLGQVLPFVGSLLFSYLGISIMIMRQRDLFELFERRTQDHIDTERGVLLDTSAIIDGRIADISRTGFIQSTILVPRFVLNELQYVADSADPLRRNRGRRGLEMLNKLQKDADVPIQITDMDIEETHDVDSKLIRLARTLHCPIITNDYNLNRVAELQGVKVLNVNELANAVKSLVLPGEDLTVRIIQEGKEYGQGVGYLEDGTMVVVDGGRSSISQTREVVVTRVLQTVAGRMIFAQINDET